MKIQYAVSSLCGVFLLSAMPAVAQTPADQAPEQTPATSRPYRGLFGPDESTTAPTTFDITATVAAAYDDDVYADAGSTITPGVEQPSGYFGMFVVGADYNWQGRRTQVGATASSALRYYSDTQELKAISHSAGLGFSSQFARRTTFSANQAFSYSPSYLYALFPNVVPPSPGDVPPPAPDYTAYDTESYLYATRVSVSNGLTRRGQLTGTFEAQVTDFVKELETRHDMTTYGAQVTFSHNVNRYTAIRFGYRYRTGDFGFVLDRRATEHGIDAGVDYSKPLSSTRKATFGFSLGSSAVDNSLTLDDLGEVDRQYRMSFDGRLGYQFNRGWQANASLRRGLEYVPGLRTPVYTTGFTATLDGLMGRRWDMHASAAFSDGESLSTRGGSNFDTYTADARIRYALGRTWALYGEYLYYYYDFRGSAQLPPGVAPVLERNGVRVGLSFWIPVIGR